MPNKQKNSCLGEFFPVRFLICCCCCNFKRKGVFLHVLKGQTWRLIAPTNILLNGHRFSRMGCHPPVMSIKEEARGWAIWKLEPLENHREIDSPSLHSPAIDYSRALKHMRMYWEPAYRSADAMGTHPWYLRIMRVITIFPKPCKDEMASQPPTACQIYAAYPRARHCFCNCGLWLRKTVFPYSATLVILVSIMPSGRE